MWRWCWLLFWLPEALLSQEDSIGGREVSLPLISIEGERSTRLKRWRVDSAEWVAVGNHLSQLLSQTEGVYLRDYGGQGGLKTLSIRGMGAPLTAVSLQGLPLRAPTLGLVNLAPFLLPALREVSFSPSANLALSPGAIGFLGFSWRPSHWRKSMGWRVAQFGEVLYYGAWETPSWLFQGSALSAMNLYPFQEPISGKRENAAYRYLQSTWAYRRARWQITGWGYVSRQEVPPPVVSGGFSGVSENLQQHFISHTLEYTLPLGQLLVQHTVERVSHVDRFTQEGRSLLHSIQGQLAFQWDRQPLRGGYTLYGAMDRVLSNRMATGFHPIPAIAQVEAAATTFIAWQEGSFYLRGEGRLTYLTRFPLQVSFVGRAGWKGWGVELLRGVRFPSLWERYWVGYGNPALSPEQSLSLQAFWEKALLYWRFYGAIFLAQTRNRIVTVPLSPIRWQAYSIGYIQSHGAEGRIEYYSSLLRIWSSATLLTAREHSFTQGGQLIYTPPYVLGWGLSLGKKRWRFLYHAQYVSWRTSSLAPSRYTILAPYHWHGVGLMYAEPRWQIEMGLENATDTSYQVIQAYPMPPRQIYARWSTSWGGK